VIGSRTYRCAVPLAGAVLLAGCARPIAATDGVGPWVPTPSVVPSATPSAARPGRSAAACPPEGVRLQPDGGDAAMGLRVLSIILVNCGTKKYRLSGYPAVQALDDDRTPLDLQVLDGVTEILGSTPWDGPPRSVTLRPGERASAAIAWRNTYDDLRKPPANGKFLRIEPLAGRPAQTVEPDAPLDFGSTGRLAVSSWRLLSGTSPSPAVRTRRVP
jgi:uncharacterized protein DUF4232